MSEPKSVTWNDVTYPSKTALAKHFKISPSSLRRAINTMGVQKTCEKYENRLICGRQNKIIIDGIEFQSQKKLADHLNVSIDAFKSMKRRKGIYETYKYYMKHSAKNKKPSAKQPVIWNEKHYESKRQLAKHFGIEDTSIFFNKIKRHGFQNACLYYEAKNKGILNLKPLFTGRDNIIRYKGKCKTCNQILILTEQEILNFTHSDNFCKNHSINII